MPATSCGGSNGDVDITDHQWRRWLPVDGSGGDDGIGGFPVMFLFFFRSFSQSLDCPIGFCIFFLLYPPYDALLRTKIAPYGR